MSEAALCKVPDDYEKSHKKFGSVVRLDNGESLRNLNLPSPISNTLSKNNLQLPTFDLTPEYLADLVNFDKRDSVELLSLLETSGGVCGIARKLNSSLDFGLSTLKKPVSNDIQARKPENSNEFEYTFTDEVEDKKSRVAVYGENVVYPPPSESLLAMIIGNIKEDVIIQVLLVSASVTLILGVILDGKTGWYEGLAIFIAVVIVLSVTAGNDWSKDRKFKKLLLLQSEKKVKVVRDGKIDEISSWKVLVGEIVDLAPGDEVPADGIYVSGNWILVDESPLTGETNPSKKSEKSPFMFSGCQVSEGYGRMLVTAVGSRSSGGQIQALLNEKQGEATPLQLKLRVVAMQIGKLGLSAGILTFFGLLIRWSIDVGTTDAGWNNAYLLKLLNFFITGVTIVVVAVPEGLPLAVTISLAFSMFKMIRDNCFVRHMSASETMGEATCICTDKTGTLTENKMTVVKFYNSDGALNGEGSSEQDSKAFNEQTFPNQYMELLSESIALNSTCFVKIDPKGTTLFVGSATEGALLVFISKMGADYESLRNSISKVENGELSFSSDKKRMASAIVPKVETTNMSKYRFHVKGASEIVLSLCSFIHDLKSNRDFPLIEEKRKEIAKLISQWASEGLRTLVIAYKDSNEEPIVDETQGIPVNIDTDLVFLGLAGIKDPIRKEVPEAVAQCQKAGLIVRMVTGDNLLTAKKIASECGILKKDGLCLEGPVFRSMSETEKKKVIPNLQVLARSSPADKYTLVSLLKQMGEVVAVTGDGTNDAPALKEADVGFAMGMSGTQIAMNASDIMLLDDNFASIVQSIKWGRNVLDVIRKFLQFQIAVNLSAILITFFGSISSVFYEPPLTAVQLLWINLIMDSLGALALASDGPEDEILAKPPHSKTENLINKNMVKYVVAVTFFQFTMSMGLLLGGYRILNISDDDTTGIHTVVFTSFVLMQIFNEILARQLNHELDIFRGILKNKLFLIIMVIILVVQMVAVQFGSSFMDTHSLNAKQWGMCIFIAFLMIPYMLLIRTSIHAYEHYAGIRLRRKTRVAPSTTDIRSTGDILKPLGYDAEKAIY